MRFTRRPGRPGTSKTTSTITAADFERGRTWLTALAEMCLTDPEWVQEGDERKYKGTGGLSINIRKGCWYDHAAEVGGISPIKLIKHLKKCDHSAAVQRLAAFLANSPGTGPCGTEAGGADDDDADPASAAECRDVLERMVEDLTGTVSKIYLDSRGIPEPYPAGLLGHLDDARSGECALVARLTEHGRITGVQLTYLTPNGEKSLIEPVRRRLNLEKSPGAVFHIPRLVGRPT